MKRKRQTSAYYAGHRAGWYAMITLLGLDPALYPWKHPDSQITYQTT